MDARAGNSDAVEHDATLMRRAAWVSVCVSIFLIAIKLGAYFLSHSVSVLAALADSGLDLFTASLNLVAIRSALTPADEEHRFGHGKAEPLAGLAQGAFIAASALFLVVQSINRFIEPEPVEQGSIALAVMIVSLFAAIGIVIYQRRVVAKTGSIAIGADSMQFIGDIATTAGVIVAIVLSAGLKWEKADPIIAMLVALALVWSAWGVFRQSYDQLMDRELADEDRAKIKAIVRAHPDVRSLHDLRTRAAGIHAFIQFHIELDPQMNLQRAHEVSDAVETEVCKAFPNAEVIIHQDPEGVELPHSFKHT
jgi:ferrous-iron efflux pump FieF